MTESELPDELLELLESKRRELSKEAQFNAMRAGVRDTAAAVSQPAVSQALDEQTFIRVALTREHDARVTPGPARRPKPKVNARKRQRQARKANR